MHCESQLTRLAALLIAVIGTLALPAHGQSVSPSTGSAAASDTVLPRDVVVSLSVVNRFFREVTHEPSSGADLTAVGNPIATRGVIYANSDNSKKVTITVDQYASSSDASSAYEEALQKSRIVPGFTPIFAPSLVPSLGANAFIGSVTQGAETHIGLGALDGTLIVGATLVGYDPTPANIVRRGC